MYFKNLKLALKELIKSKDIWSAIVNGDRLGNALAAGDYRTTISGRVGYFALTKSNPYWLLLQWIIDETFRPFEGKRHCFRAYKWEREKGLSHRRGSDLALSLLSILIIAACLILAPIIWTASRFKKA